MNWDSGNVSTSVQVPGCELLYAAGRGATGRVFVARQTALNRLVAIKFLSFDADADPEERLARFRREAAIMAGLSHPHVVSIFFSGEIDEIPYLVMEFVSDGDLRRRMTEGKPMPNAQVLSVLKPVGEALDYLHGKGILHRDLKPENILMLVDGIPKVADFGIAVERSESGEITRSGQGLGTLGYVAPEQQYRLPVDERADQYSLAAMTYEMLTGQRPLGVFKPPSHHNPQLSEETDLAVMKGLQEDPSDRFPSVLTFCRAVQSTLEPGAKTAVATNKRHSTGALAALATFFLLIGIWAFRPPPGGPPWPPPPWGRPPFVQMDGDVRRAQPVLTAQAAPKVPDREISPQFKALTAICAQNLWKEMGSPANLAKPVDDANWLDAEMYLHQYVDTQAYEIYVERGGPKLPPDPAMSGQDWEEAERRAWRKFGSPR